MAGVPGWYWCHHPRIKAGAGHIVVLGAERFDNRDPCAGNSSNGDRVVFLQRDVGRLAGLMTAKSCAAVAPGP
jgi:hypothetical protein